MKDCSRSPFHFRRAYSRSPCFSCPMSEAHHAHSLTLPCCRYCKEYHPPYHSFDRGIVETSDFDRIRRKAMLWHYRPRENPCRYILPS